MRLATLTADSSNRKLTADPKQRKVSVTRAAQTSCPTACGFHPLRGGGCYANESFSGIHTSKLNEAAAASPADTTAQDEADAIRERWTRDGRPLRLHEVGDCATPSAARVVAQAVLDAQQEGAGQCWTYTHAWRDVPRNSWGGVSVLASCETLLDVAAANAKGYAAALVVEEFEGERVDSRGIACPAQTGAAADCASCQLCWKDSKLRKPILFEAHGTGAKRVKTALARAAR